MGDVLQYFGRPKKRLGKLKKMICRELLDGGKRWTDLKNNKAIMKEAGSKSKLSEALKELVCEKRIEQNKKKPTSINVPYTITAKGRVYAKTPLGKYELVAYRNELVRILGILRESPENREQASKCRKAIDGVVLDALASIATRDDSEIRWAGEHWFGEELLPLVIECLALIGESQHTDETKNTLTKI